MSRWVLLALALISCASDLETPPGPLDGGEPMDTVDPVAADCAKGCSGPTPDETHPIEAHAIAEHVASVSTEPLGDPSLALETLLFHGAATSAWLDANPDALDSERRAFLRRQLARHDVRVEFRLLDDDGTVRGEATRVSALKEKQHIPLQGTGTLKRIEINGKTKRVGLEHLWSRW